MPDPVSEDRSAAVVMTAGERTARIAAIDDAMIELGIEPYPTIESLQQPGTAAVGAEDATACDMCHRHYATVQVNGKRFCRLCERYQPVGVPREPVRTSWERRWFPVVVLCAALVASGCVRRVRPEPDVSPTLTAFSDHRALYAKACREIAAKAADGGYANDRAFLDDHNAKSAACRDGAFQQHADRIQGELGEGKWSNEATADLFTRIADELEGSR